jgi:hypothetical protein
MCIHLAASHAHAECLERLLQSDNAGHANSTMNNGKDRPSIIIPLPWSFLLTRFHYM